MNNNEKLNHKGLPAMEDVYSTLTKESITEGNYKHANIVYDKLGCKTRTII